MTEKEVLKIFKSEKALLEGHFLLSSGLHSPNYMQCALLFQKPWIAKKLCDALAKKLAKTKVDAVIGPALGGVIVSYEVGRALKVRSLFAERVDGTFTLRRGFELKKNEKVLVVEDVVTTGKSTYEVIDVVNQAGARPVAVAAIVDRSDGAAIFQEPFHALLKMYIKTYRPEECPICREGKIPLTKPGSRGLKVSA
ncbi:MAG: orotate phosphoribosyltransferase [Candidatus Omnitrophota bacterium]